MNKKNNIGKKVVLVWFGFNMEGIMEILCADRKELENKGKNGLNQRLEGRELLEL